MQTIILIFGLLVFLYSIIINYKFRNLPFSLISILYIVSYFFDMISIYYYGSLYFSQNTYQYSYSQSSFYKSIMIISTVYLLYSILYVLFGRLKFNNTSNWYLSNFSAQLVLIITFVIGLYIYRDGINIEDILRVRQLFFNESFLATAFYYIIPYSAIISYSLIKNNSNVRKIIYLSVFVIFASLTLLTGSRSSFILNIILPIIIGELFYIKNIDFKRKILVLLLLPGIYIGSGYFRDATRGDQRDINTFVSVDYTQSDALILVVDENLRSKQNTYVASLEKLLPRAIRSENSMSGNQFLSSQVFSNRYAVTLTETTAGLLGEGYINYGYFSIILVPFIMIFFVIFMNRILISSSGPTMIFLALSIVFRISNIIRGDFLGAILPLIFGMIILTIVRRRSI